MITTAARGEPMSVLVRAPGSGDQGYVASTWVEALAMADHLAKRRALGLLVDRLLDHPNVKCLLAVDPARPGYIFGWLVWTPIKAIRLVHFAYTRAGLRDRGVQVALRDAAGLADDRPLVFTMRGKTASSLLRKYPNAIEQPLKEFLEP